MRARRVAYGTVQGVGFRWFIQREARRRGLAGYVLNRADGGVELEVEGDPAEVGALLRTLQHGPPGARVERIEELPASGHVPELPFAIRRTPSP